MNRVAIIQARIGSTRLPGKVLMPLGAVSVLECVIDRVEASQCLDSVIVATSESSIDDVVAHHARLGGALVSRGPAEDVLARFEKAAQEASADVIVRITSDCPLVDPVVIDAMLKMFQERPCDYLSNTVTRTFPRGLDVEVFTRKALSRAAAEARESYQREHVTPYLYQHPELFSIRQYVDASGADRSKMRWTLDTAEDYAFLRAVYESRPHSRPSDVTTESVMELLARHPEIADLNSAVPQKALGE